MAESSPRRDGAHAESASRGGGGPSPKSSCTCRHATVSPRAASISAVDRGGGDLIECSGNYCGSCTAGLIADCVALCCCPCALVNIVAFAFVKVPWMVGRKCVVRMRKKKKKKKKKVKSGACDGDRTAEDDGDGRRRRVEEGIVWGEEEEMGGFEAERVWLELYKDGHLGFGRVSFTGIS